MVLQKLYTEPFIVLLNLFIFHVTYSFRFHKLGGLCDWSVCFYFSPSGTCLWALVPISDLGTPESLLQHRLVDLLYMYICLFAPLTRMSYFSFSMGLDSFLYSVNLFSSSLIKPSPFTFHSFS